MAWDPPVVSAVLTVDAFYEPFLDSSGEPIIIFLKPREVVHFTFSVDTAGATDTLDWEILGGNRIVNNVTNGLDGIGADKISNVVTNADNDMDFAAAHEIYTAGDGPFRLTGSSIPTGWAAATDYWMIVSDSDTLQLAASTQAAALAGTAVTISDDGDDVVTIVTGGKGTILLGLNTVADTQADDYYNEMYIHLTSGSANATFRLIANYANSGDVASLLHSSDGVPAAGDLYDIYAMSQVVDGSASITTVVATAPVEASPMNGEFGMSGYPVVIPRARASGGTDAHNVIMTYTIDRVDA